MTGTSDTYLPGCPIRISGAIFGDRWTMLILRDFLFRGYQHYGEFLRNGESISTSILADRLVRLENAGIVSRQTDPENRTRRIYRLTEKGRALRPVFLSIMDWAIDADPASGMTRAFLDRLRLQAPSGGP